MRCGDLNFLWVGKNKIFMGWIFKITFMLFSRVGPMGVGGIISKTFPYPHYLDTKNLFACNYGLYLRFRLDLFICGLLFFVV